MPWEEVVQRREFPGCKGPRIPLGAPLQYTEDGSTAQQFSRPSSAYVRPQFSRVAGVKFT